MATPAAVAGSEPDIVPLVGRQPWLRLRIGTYRVIFRPVTAAERAIVGRGHVVGRIVHRRDLEKAAQSLA